MNEPAAVKQIKDSDLWILLTDGEIYARDVTTLSSLAEQRGVSRIPVILVVVGGGYTTPRDEKISVGVSFFASTSDALILFKNHVSGTIYVLDAKGAFAGLGHGAKWDLSSWARLPQFKDERAFKTELKSRGIEFDPDRSQHQLMGISLGKSWDASTDHALVKVGDLLQQQKVSSHFLQLLLQEEAFEILALACKTRGQLKDLHDFLLRHKEVGVVIHFEDRHGAGKIMSRLQVASDGEEKAKLSEDLRVAHAANRDTYQHLRDSPSEEVQRIQRVNRLIDQALQTTSEYEKSSYTAEILDRKSNRARRAEKVSAADVQLKQVNLNLSTDVTAFRDGCSICCGDKEIMSVTLKRLDSVEENTGDFALDFPLAAAQARQNADIISSQMVCFQCALLMERSIYKEDVAAIIPIVDLKGANREFIAHQLYLALTAGLAVGASPVVQLFAAILDRTLETKKWCTKDNNDDPEVASRRGALTWLLHNLLRNCPCRENFTSTGRWVKYPVALEWAAKEFHQAGMDSWIMQYPIAGFTQLMRWYEIVNTPVEQKLLRAIRHAKLIHFVTSKVMDGLKSHGYGDMTWKILFLELLYSDFNAPGVPKDLGPDSIVSSTRFWHKLRAALNADQWSDVRLFLTLFQPELDADVTKRVQMITYWALFHQKSHAMPKTVFAKLRADKPFAFYVLDPFSSLAASSVDEEVSSIFCPKLDLDPHDGLQDVASFCSPYGPSVLHCSHPGCGTKFHGDEADLKNQDGKLQLKLREGRAKHLSDVYSTKRDKQGMRKLIGQTGLPEATTAPEPPSGSHYTLHVSVAKVWARMTVKERLSVMRRDRGSVDRFAKEVKEKICQDSRGMSPSPTSRGPQEADNPSGNIYTQDMDTDIHSVLPSFFQALRKASRRAGLVGDEDHAACRYELNFANNTILWKMTWELELEPGSKG